MKRVYAALVLSTVMLYSSAQGQDALKIVDWNAEALFEPSHTDARGSQLQQFADDLAPDIVLLEEVTKRATVERIREKMGLASYHIAMSDFEQNDDGEFNSLEVAILSRLPLANIVEFDRSLDNQGGDPDEQKLERVDLPGIAETSASRGFLYAEVPDAKLILIVTHLKSSNGNTGAPDRANAQKRELVTAAIAERVNEALQVDGNEFTVLVAGDFNVGETDSAKNGTDLEEDRTGSQSGDRYDDTHAILGEGLIGGLRMTSLTKGLGRETYVGTPSFPGTGPIDVIYVAGPQAQHFTLAGAGTQSYGSDHLPVFTTFGSSGGVIPPDPVDPPPVPLVLQIAALLPNPAGADEGQEWVELQNATGAAIDLGGWLLVDRAGNELALEGTIAAGAVHRIELAAGELPLNNSGGDEVRLVSPGGDIKDSVSYTGQQAAPGATLTRDDL